jgi:hypothetical protein
LDWDFFTALFAPRIARESEPVRSKMESATLDHCRFRFGDFAFFVKRVASLGVHGIDQILWLPTLESRRNNWGCVSAGSKSKSNKLRISSHRLLDGGDGQ